MARVGYLTPAMVTNDFCRSSMAMTRSEMETLVVPQDGQLALVMIVIWEDCRLLAIFSGSLPTLGKLDADYQ